ncbi:MAG: hypothetical protein INH41_16520 [Myxococcaceae bacterium]|jgi:pilus assembly protein FimV|nr:hypothetical protein [Myxococcaceae bacterium]
MDVALLLKLAEVCQRLGELHKAADALVRVAAFWAADGFFLKAVALVKWALKLRPERWELSFALADLHLKLQVPDDAIAYLHLGPRAANQAGDRMGSFAAAKTLIAVEPSNPGFRLFFAHLLLWADRADEATSELREALVLLRTSQPDLAEQADRLLREPKSAMLDGLKRLRLEVFGRTDLDRQLAVLDFEVPT